MRPAVFSPQARDDLKEIWSFIAQDNLDEADRFELEVYAEIVRLEKNPRLGHRRADLTSEPVLFRLVRKRYLLVYLPLPLVILRILHSSRDVSALV